MLSRNSLRAVVAALASLFSAASSNNALGTTWADGDLITYPQGYWSDDPTAFGLLDNNFTSVYASSFGIVEAGIPGGFSIMFSDAGYVRDYLPSGGPLGPLNANLMNPTSTSSGRFGGEVLALRLNIDFSAAGLTLGALGIPFGDLEFYNLSTLPLLNGLTVRQFLGQANTRLGGGSGTYSIAQLGEVTAELNSSFGAGGVSQFARDHLRIDYLAGDFEEDGDVDGADLAIWKAAFGASGHPYRHWQGNADSDLDVDGADFLIWQRQVGASIFASAPVPEPAAAGLALVGLVALARRRRRAAAGSVCTSIL